MNIQGKAFIAGAGEHPVGQLPDRSVGPTYADVRSDPDAFAPVAWAPQPTAAGAASL